MKYFLMTAVTLLTLSGCTTKTKLPAYNVNQSYDERSYSSIVQLRDVKTGKFVCSGVVISDDYVLTAAHCVTNKGQPIHVKSNKNTITKASVVGLADRMDYALLLGDFKKFTREIILFSDKAPLAMTGPAGKVATCGFPFGSKNPICYQAMTKVFDNQFFQIVTDGLLYPGMSGGPVVDMDNGIVIGINSAVKFSGRTIIISPLIGLFNNFEIEVKE